MRPIAHSAAIAAPKSARTSALPGFIERLFAVAQAWLARRAVLAELQGLDDHTLADLRLYRGDFQAIADGSYIREGGAHDVAPKLEASTRIDGRYY
jgi:uncharacterized protein YjiS (DUF1127 family)